MVISYNDEKLKNFHLLNKEVFKSQEDSLSVSHLQEAKKKALDSEDYEEADRLQKKIDKLSK